MKIRIFVTIAILGLIFASCNRTNNEEHIAEQIEESKSVYQTGYTLMIERQYEKAQKSFQKAIKLDKTNAQAWYDLSTTLIELGKYSKAKDAAIQAAEFYENAALYDDKIAFRNDALVQAGEAYLWAKKTKQAMAQFQAVYALDPTNYDTLQNIITTYIRCEYANEAVMFCQKNIKSFQNNASILAPLYLMYANCVYALGKENDARDALQIAREQSLRADTRAYDEQIETLQEQLTYPAK